jgi:hypothetical protein
VLPTPLVLATNLPLPTAERFCSLPRGWATYTAQVGDTLYDIAEAAGRSIEELLDQNCLLSIDEITPGMSIYVPFALPVPLPTVAPVAAPNELPEAVGCTSPGVRIIAPGAGQAVTGVFALVGAASLPPSGSYTVEVRADSVTTYTLYGGGRESVIGGALAQINSDLFGDGLYWIRLVVRDASQTPTQSCAIPVIFR